jgi:hypothetical protein
MKTSILLLLTILMISCCGEKKQSRSSENFIEISFGSGGGFTGAVNTYLLKSDRKVFKLNKGEQVEINKISKSESKIIVEQIKKTDFFNLKMSEKGNMTYFIEIKSASGTNKVTWADNTQCADLKDFYKALANTLTQK